MNIIYNKTLDFLRAAEHEQRTLFYDVKALVIQSMNTKDDNTLNLALQKAQEENNAMVWNSIQEHIVNVVNTFEYEKDGKKYISHLLILPFMLFPNHNNVTLPAIEQIESWWRKSLSYHYLTYPGGLEFNMAPVVLSKNNAYTMSMLDWYQIHKANSLTLNKRNARSMFVSPFAIKVTENQANLNFFVATLNFEIENSSYTPLLELEEEQMNALENCMSEINDQFFDYIENTQFLSMPIGSIHNTIGYAFETYQDTLLHNMIEKYSDNSDIRFILVPNNDQKFFTLCAWHESQNIILDAVSITQYVNSFSEITEFILNELEYYDFSTLYVGNAVINIEEFSHLPSINLNEYIQTYGVNAVSTGEDSMNEYSE